MVGRKRFLCFLIFSNTGSITDHFEITDPECERRALTDTLVLLKVRNETDSSQRIKHDGYMFFWTGPPQLALDKFKTLLYVKLIDATKVELCVPKVSGSFLSSYTRGKQQLIRSNQLSQAQAESLDACVTHFNEIGETELRRKILVEFKTGAELSLVVTRHSGGAVLGGKYGFVAPSMDIVNGSFVEEISGTSYGTTEVWAAFFIPIVEARPMDPTTNTTQSGNLLYANLESQLRGMSLE